MPLAGGLWPPRGGPSGPLASGLWPPNVALHAPWLVASTKPSNFSIGRFTENGQKWLVKYENDKHGQTGQKWSKMVKMPNK